ncbi:hypothetical protein RJT34_29924 [Clitoria ternatea]|uniref:Uncharacterized protein n=1 Tax=Clitoria ternatea TaxID=43366 RepID=A0AAN9ETK7_CLITE
MQSMLNLRGVPLCLSGITNPLSLSDEMADHDRRRKAMKRQRQGVHAIATQHIITTERAFLDINEDLSQGSTAKAA